MPRYDWLENEKMAAVWISWAYSLATQVSASIQKDGLEHEEMGIQPGNSSDSQE